ncbi:acyltransferase family protein [Geopseudomonas aromaticivorans]
MLRQRHTHTVTWLTDQELPHKASAQHAYRNDIQGIRAISALMIAVYHIWINKVSGGVDVFFVISGFLMGGVLIRQLYQYDGIRPLVFWGSLIKRIAPGACTVLLVTLIMGYFLVPEPLWSQLIKETILSALNFENIGLMWSSVDYLARELPPSPTQQFWALSTQVQFYLILPMVLATAFWASRKSESKTPLLAAVGLVIMCSLLYSIVETSRSPSSSYFNPVARAWEFFAGVLLALLLPRISLGSILRNILGLLGLATLLLFGLLTPETAKFPGYMAVIPVAAAVMLIISGSSQSPAAANLILSHRYLTAIGKISFGIYLWHWPLLAYSLEYMGTSRLSLPHGLAIILLSILLAMATNKYIEEPIKNRKHMVHKAWAPYFIGLVFLAPVLASAASWKYYIHNIVVDEMSHNSREGTSDNVIAPAQIQENAIHLSDAHLITSKIILPASYKDKCHQEITLPEVVYCEYGDTTATASIALVGGSHATQWLPALDKIGKANHLKVLNITKKECPLGVTDEAHPSCVEWNKRVIEKLAQLNPQAVITNSTTTTNPKVREYVPQPYLDQWKKLENLGIKVIGIRDNPSFGFDPATCVARHKENTLACSTPRAKSLSDIDPSSQYLSKLSNLNLVDMSEFLCTSEKCLTVTHDFLMYRDSHHLNPRYVIALTERLHEKLVKASPEVFKN